ncbi:unnamed protein product [Caretta caretta]
MCILRYESCFRQNNLSGGFDSGETWSIGIVWVLSYSGSFLPLQAQISIPSAILTWISTDGVKCSPDANRSFATDFSRSRIRPTLSEASPEKSGDWWSIY